MERTRSNFLTFIIAMFSKTEEVSTEKRKLDSLKNKDYIKAGVTNEERAELTASTSKIKVFVDKILKGKKSKNNEITDELEKKYGPAKPGNSIYDQGQKMNDMEAERAREE